MRSRRPRGSAARSPTTSVSRTNAWPCRAPGRGLDHRGSASQIAHPGLPFANPMREADVDRALGRLGLGPGALVLDTGCGNGEMLLRALAHDPTWRGLGVDLDPDAIAAAQAAASRAPPRPRRALRGARRGRGHGPPRCRPQRRLLARPRRLPGRAAGAARARRGRRHGRARRGLLARAAVARLPRSAGRRDRGRALGQSAACAPRCSTLGFDIASLTEAGEADWAAYEETLAANAEADGGAETAAYAQRIRDRRALPDGTTTLGFALLVLRARA